jgi:hypothetical protein
MNYLEKRPHPEGPSQEVAVTHTSAPEIWVPGNDSLGNFQESSDSEQLLRYLAVLKARWQVILFAAVMGIVAGIVVSLTQTPIYRARTSLEVQNANQTSISSARESFRNCDLRMAQSKSLHPQTKKLKANQHLTQQNSTARLPFPQLLYGRRLSACSSLQDRCLLNREPLGWLLERSSQRLKKMTVSSRLPVILQTHILLHGLLIHSLLNI